MKNFRKNIAMILLAIMAGHTVMPFSILTWPGSLVSWAGTAGEYPEQEILTASGSDAAKVPIASPGDAGPADLDDFISMETEPSEIPDCDTEAAVKYGEEIFARAGDGMISPGTGAGFQVQTSGQDMIITVQRDNILFYGDSWEYSEPYCNLFLYFNGAVSDGWMSNRWYYDGKRNRPVDVTQLSSGGTHTTAAISGLDYHDLASSVEYMRGEGSGGNYTRMVWNDYWGQEMPNYQNYGALAIKVETLYKHVERTSLSYGFRITIRNPDPKLTGIAINTWRSRDAGEGSSEVTGRGVADSFYNLSPYVTAIHKHIDAKTGAEIVTKQPTCTEPGHAEGTCFCSSCGTIDEDIPALGHAYGSWVRTQEPSCTATGVDTRTCLRDASHKENRSVDALGHSAPEVYNTTANDGTYFKDCIRCGTRLETQYNPYNIRFHANASDAAGIMEDQAMTYNMTKALSENMFERRAYLFDGWSTDADGIGTAYADRQEVKNLTEVWNGNVDLYAKWKLNECTLTYDGNGGTSPVSTAKVICKTDIGQPSLPEAVRFGYTFLGWSAEKDRPDRLAGPESQFDTIAVTLYAQWKANSYNVNFDPAGGTLTQTRKDAYYEMPLGSLPVPQKQGVSFTGWVENTKTGDMNVPVTESTILKKAGMDLIATYAEKAYTIRFDANGGVTDAQPIQRAYGRPYGTLPLAERTGYALKGWFTEREGGIQITENSLTPAYDQTLYAHWYPAAYTITFDANGGSGMMPDQAMIYGVSQELRANRFLNQYHQFVGWALKEVPEEGDVIYIDTQPVSNLTERNGDQVVLYAQWMRTGAPCVFYDWDSSLIGTEVYELGNTIDYPAPDRKGYHFVRWEGLDGASVSNIQGPGNYIAVYEVNTYPAVFMNGDTVAGRIEKNYGEVLGILPEAEKEGHTFIGWYTSPEGGTRVAEDTPVKAGDAVYYAQFSVNTYTITFHYNGGTESIGSMDCGYGQKLGTLPETEKTGFVFSGWNTASDGKGAFVGADSVMGAAKLDLYAVWDIRKVLCVFLDDEGKLLEEQYVGYDGTASPGIPKKTGYLFTGWDKSLEHITGKMTFIAGFRPIEYRIGFAVNQEMYPGAAGDMQTQDVLYDVIAKLPAGSYTYEHFSFTGWTAAADGTGTLIGDQAGVINLSVTDGATVVLYAQFVRAESPCRFVDWDGTLLKEALVPYGKDGNTPAEPVRTGYQFSGWYPGTTGITEPTTFTARYTPNRYYAVFDPNTADGSMEKQEFVYDVQEALDGNGFHKDDYVFTGWNTKADGSGDSYADGQNVMNLTGESDAAVTLYAQWKLLYEDRGDGTHIRPGEDKILGTEDDEVWNNGPDGKPGTADDYRKENSGTGSIGGGSSGGSSGGGGGRGGSAGAASVGIVSGAGNIPAYAVTGTWFRHENGKWMFRDSARTYADEWAAVVNPYANLNLGQHTFDWFCFDSDGFMVTGWYDDADGNRYALHTVSDGSLGHMYTGWHWIDGRCYYFKEESDGSRGALKRNTVTPDGFMVNEKGEWVVNGEVQMKTQN